MKLYNTRKIFTDLLPEEQSSFITLLRLRRNTIQTKQQALSQDEINILSKLGITEDKLWK